MPNTTAHPMPFAPALIYRGVVVRVIDGDTVRCQLDLGFDVGATVDVRIEGLFAPELRGVEAPQGRAAKEMAEALLPPGSPIVLYWSKRRSFARYVGVLQLVYADGAMRSVAGVLAAQAPQLFLHATNEVRHGD